MKAVVGFGILAIILNIALKKKWIKKSTWTRWLQVIALLGGIATILVFVIPSATSKEEGVIEITNTPENLSTSTPAPPVRVGIVVGHWGYDTGAVCPPSLGGYKEVDVNFNIATLVQQLLEVKNVEVDLLKEFDSGLTTYQGSAIISIHMGSCEYIEGESTGFKITTALSKSDDESSNKLVKCITENYQSTTGLYFQGSITPDMSVYHSFDEVFQTPIAIIEAGYLNQDSFLLTQEPSIVALGIFEGIQCFIENEVKNFEEIIIKVLDIGNNFAERVYIKNISENEYNLSGWKLLDQHGNIFPFPNIPLSPNSEIVIYTRRAGLSSSSELFWNLKPSDTWQDREQITLIDVTGKAHASDIIDD